jgi:hypothetical protein
MKYILKTESASTSSDRPLVNYVTSTGGIIYKNIYKCTGTTVVADGNYYTTVTDDELNNCFDFSKCTNGNEMFENNNNLVNVHLTGTSKITAFYNMFGNCNNLESLYIDASSFQDGYADMFNFIDGSNKLKYLELYNSVKLPKKIENHPDSLITLKMNCDSMYDVSIGATNLTELYATNIGKCSNLSDIYLSYIGVLSRESALFTFVENLFDRKSAGYTTLKIIDGNTKLVNLTTDEKAQITAKGYNIL